MLTFQSQDHCRLLEAYALADAKNSRTLGQPGALTLLVVQAGSCSLLGDDGEWPAQAGDLAAAPGLFALEPAGRCDALGVCLAGNAPAQAAAALPGPLVRQAALYPAAGETLRQLQEGAGRLPDAEASALGYSLLCRLAGGQAGRGLSPLVAAAVAEMREHHGEVYGVEELAAGLEVSKSHLIRRFTAEMGTSPGQYLTRVRVEAAKLLLLRGDYPLDVVAGLCGFSGANYLCKVFKKETGETPAAWRRRAAPVADVSVSVLDEQMYL